MSVPSLTQANRTSESAYARGQRWQTTLTFWLFVGPMVLGLIVFTYIPILWGFALSFFDARMTLTPQDFVGLGNYIEMLTDANFTRSLVTFGLFALFIVPTTFGLSLSLALLVNSVKFAQGFFRSVFFLPTACSYVVASLVWKMNLFNSLPFGFANIVLDWFRLDPIVWIGTIDPPWYWVVLITGAAVAPVGLLYDHLPGWLAGDSALALRGRLCRWRAPRLVDLPVYHLPAAA